jgi:hypothetical protein
MNNFIEPQSSRPPSVAIEIELSTPDIDIEHADITIMPELSGLTYVDN